MGQTWEDLLFIHWPIKAKLLRELIPEPFEIDTFDGFGWIGVVPFCMTNIHFRNLPPVPFFSNFLELNVRSYVKWKGKAGVYFFSLDAENSVAVEVARNWFCLPYFNARMSKSRQSDHIHYKSERVDRRGRNASFEAMYCAIGEAEVAQAGTLAHWLTERYCFWAINHSGRPIVGEIHHQPWPLQAAQAEIRQNNYAEVLGVDLPKTDQPLLHFARKLETIEWATSLVVWG